MLARSCRNLWNPNFVVKTRGHFVWWTFYNIMTIILCGLTFNSVKIIRILKINNLIFYYTLALYLKFSNPRYSVKASGSESSATLQPFYTLQLDIQRETVKNVTDALAENFASEILGIYHQPNVFYQIHFSTLLVYTLFIWSIDLYFICFIT